MTSAGRPVAGGPTAAYVHIPFCVSKCFYCDFSSFAGMESLHDEYVAAVVSEIEHSSRPDWGQLDSVYIGGGTPTVLSADQLAMILTALDRAIGIGPDCEITIEANPGTVDRAKLSALRRAGFNRLSLGVQSFDDAFLKRIGRIHNAASAVEAYLAAREAGFGNVGIDLIFALPGQTISHWAQTLTRAVELSPEHVSLYELSIEEGTRFAEMCASGELDLPSEDARLEMYEQAISIITGAGYEHYEVSNFARPGFRSRHNQVYWRNEPYYGFGASATSYLNGERARRVSSPRAYIDSISSDEDAIESSERLTGRALLAETIIQGLRMLEGIDLHRFRAETCADLDAEFAGEIAALEERGLVERSQGRLKVTHQGLLLMNDVAMEFLPGDR